MTAPQDSALEQICSCSLLQVQAAVTSFIQL